MEKPWRRGVCLVLVELPEGGRTQQRLTRVGISDRSGHLPHDPWRPSGAPATVSRDPDGSDRGNLLDSQFGGRGHASRSR
jgi:hypothetical protein